MIFPTNPQPKETLKLVLLVKLDNLLIKEPLIQTILYLFAPNSFSTTHKESSFQAYYH